MIRFGYTCQLIEENKKVSSSHIITYKKYLTLTEKEKMDKLIEIGKKNLKNLLYILEYNYKNNILFFRISSRLIPLATHPDVDWDYLYLLKDEFNNIKEFLNGKNIRIDMHPGHFVLLNSQNQEVIDRSMKDLIYHYNVMNAMGIDPKIVMHIGTFKPTKEEAILRFKNTFNNLPLHIQNMIMLENDDKTFTANETYWLCKDLNIPMVFDIHHHRCNFSDFYIEWFFDTWIDSGYPPKMHWSSPKNVNKDKYDKAHADYINIKNYKYIYDMILNKNIDVDIMLETKMKNISLKKLLNEL